MFNPITLNMGDSGYRSFSIDIHSMSTEININIQQDVANLADFEDADGNVSLHFKLFLNLIQ